MHFLCQDIETPLTISTLNSTDTNMHVTRLKKCHLPYPSSSCYIKCAFTIQKPTYQTRKQTDKINRQITERQLDRLKGRQVARQDYIMIQSDNKDFLFLVHF